MSLKSKLLSCACLLVVLGWAGSSQAVWYSVSAGGGQAQIGDGLPIPIQVPQSTMGGANSTGGPIGTKMNFPDKLLIPLNTNPAKLLVDQSGSDPMKMKVFPGVFKRTPAGPSIVGVQLNNPTVFQVKTNIAFSGPGTNFGTATFSKLGRTGAAVTTFVGVPTASARIKYTASANQFGGPSRTKIVPASEIKVWASPASMAPCKHTKLPGGTDPGCVAFMLKALPNSKAVAGAAVASPNDVTPGGFVVGTGPNAGRRGVNVNTNGTVLSETSIGMTSPISNMATSDGFPWTDGKIEIKQPTAVGGPETFTITGMDTRVGGVGQLSLVSGALSTRTTSGPNSNRSWAQYTLPEPGAVLGAAAALAVLGVCHGLVRRRSR